MTLTGLELRGLSAAVERKRGAWRPVLLDANRNVVAEGKWDKLRGLTDMYNRADALLRRHVGEVVRG